MARILKRPPVQIRINSPAMQTPFLLPLIFALTTTVTFAQENQDEMPPQYLMGLSLDYSKDTAIALIQKTDGFGIDLPEEMSLQDFTPAVRSQGGIEASGGWAAGYYLASTEWALITNQWRPSIRTVFAYDPLHLNYAASVQKEGCQAETYLSDLCLELLNNGAKRWAIDRSSCDDLVQYDESQALMDFTRLMRLTDRNLSVDENILSVKNSIANYHPVVFSMHTPQSFVEIGSDGLFVPSASDRELVNDLAGHGLTIVGYDDNQYGGAFRVVNSWGEAWGDGGFCWITYEDFNTFQVAAYSFVTVLKKPDLVAYGADADGFGRKRVKKFGYFEGYLDEKGNPDKGIYTNEKMKKCRGGKSYMKRLIKKNGGYLIYSEDNFDIPIAAVIY